MVTPKPPFLTGADIAGLHDIAGAGYRTVQEFNDPQVLLDIVRQNPATGRYTSVVAGNIRPISIRMGGQQAEQSPGETRTQGLLKAWASDIAPYGDGVIQPGDRFVWQDHWCRVDVVYPSKLGTITVDFTLMEGN